ncbi:MAG: TetR family transcriptional regulator C-terminal domain-containing protein [Proteobacteria bacterium]|nr:TetR family transcriptional regulator C-terminal domain-containing protein [Pseudomonadota bacterium]
MAASDISVPTRPRKERAENAAKRRRQIIEATIRSVVGNGLAGTTLATVSAEAGLSQGVAVFYFHNKQTLLGEVLRHQYEIYQETWQRALAQAGGRPIDRVIALIRADFDPRVFDAQSLVIWHAFWGEAGTRPLYAQISGKYDAARFVAICGACTDLLAGIGRPAAEAAALATGIDALTDGLWLRAYLSAGTMDRQEALAITARFLAAAFPEHAEDFIAGLCGGD